MNKQTSRTLKKVHPWLVNRKDRHCSECGRVLPLRNWRRECASCIKRGQLIEKLRSAAAGVGGPAAVARLILARDYAEVA